MKKFTFLVYHKEYEEFLKDLQGLGVLHVIEKASGEIDNEATRESIKLAGQLANAIRLLQKRKGTGTPTTGAETDGLAILKQVTTIQAEIDANLQKLASLQKETELLGPWGDFSVDTMEKIIEKGFSLKFFITPTKKFNPHWGGQYPLSVISETNGKTFFAIVLNDGEQPVVEAEEVRLPIKSLSSLLEQRVATEASILKLEEGLDLLAAHYIPSLEKTRDKLLESVSYEKVVLNTSREADEKLLLLEGWVPAETEVALNSYLERSGVYAFAQAPGPEDKVPVKLKNNRFNQLLEPVGELYTLPNYKELDLTPFFAPFFVMFFGFCLGDVGYGMILLLAAIFMRSRVSKALKPALTLGIFLGSATVLMGVLSGTLFGIDLARAAWPWLAFLQENIIMDYNGLMMLSFGVGIVQIIFGIFLKVVNITRISGFRYALSTIGWLVLIFLAITVYLLTSRGGYTFEQLKPPVYIVGGIGGFMVFFLNSPGKNVFLNFGLGIWDTYGMLSGLLGDVLSYVRLFALGISSAVLGNVFNQLALSASPDIPVVGQLVMLVILLFGHGLNLFMAALGAFVHPLRLTFVEFYKNAGFAGGGQPYNPFRKYQTD